MRRSSHTTRWLGGLVLALCLMLPAERARAAVTTEQLRKRIDELVEQLRGRQERNGSWHARITGGTWSVGTTSLAVLALRAAGVAPTDRDLQRAGQFLADRGSPWVYEMSLRIMALAELDPVKYKQQIADSANFLVLAQHKGGASKGGWGYKQTGSRADNSISQFAVLGLRSAARVGVMIPNAVWRDAMDYYKRGQRGDGSWFYVPGYERQRGYGSMTAAGVASLHICSLQLHIANGVCGQYESDANIAKGISWLGKHFSVRENPGRRQHHYYYLYALERAGVIAARRYFGNHDWYREGVEYLVGNPRGVDSKESFEGPVLRRCYALLFLAKGRAPVVMHKAEWIGAWNKHRFDAEFLTQFVSHHFGDEYSWQSIDIRTPVRQLLEAPVLLVSGSGRAPWTDAQIDNLREYLNQGGFLFVVAVKGDQTFDKDFRGKILPKMFPNRDMISLPKHHPVYTSLFDLRRNERVPLYGFSTGHCKRSPLIYSPNDLTCEWDVADFSHYHFKVGANVIAYATGMERIKEKLDPVVLKRPPEEVAVTSRGAFRIGDIVHGGEWRPHENAWPRLLGLVREKANVDVVSRPVPVRLGQDDPFQAHMLYLTGYESVNLSDESKAKLKNYLERGGFLFAEAFCGSEKFDKGFRELIKELWPDDKLERLPQNHDLLKLGKSLDRVRYTRLAREKYPGLDQPYLEYLKLEGRVVLIYSKFDLNSAVDGMPCFDVIGVEDPDATQLAMKIVLFSLAQ